MYNAYFKLKYYVISFHKNKIFYKRLISNKNLNKFIAMITYNSV